MDEYEALAKAIEKIGAKTFFIALGYKVESDDWKNGYRLIRQGSGYRNNIHRAVELLDQYLSIEGVDPEPILRFLCDRYGFDAVARSPAPGISAIGLKETAELQHEKADTIATLADALADGKVTVEELRRIIRQAEEDVRKTQALINACRRKLREAEGGTSASPKQGR